MDLTGRKCNLKEADAYVLLLNIMFDLIINCQWWRGRSCSALLRVQCFAFKENKWRKFCLSVHDLTKDYDIFLHHEIMVFKTTFTLRYKLDNETFWLAFSFLISFFLFFLVLFCFGLVLYMKTSSDKWFWIED